MPRWTPGAGSAPPTPWACGSICCIATARPAVDGQDRTLTAAALGTDYQGERLRLAADVGYQDHRIDAPRPSVTPIGEIPDPADAGANFAQPWTYTDEEQLFGVVRAEYDLSPSVTVWPPRAAAAARSATC